jgi:hypothetical protein
MHDSASSCTQRLATRLGCALLYPKAASPRPDEEDIQDPASELPRIPIPRTPVNKGKKEKKGRDIVAQILASSK